MKSDSEIKRDVEDELRWDPDIDATDIAVAVKNGAPVSTSHWRTNDVLEILSGCSEPWCELNSTIREYRLL